MLSAIGAFGRCLVVIATAGMLAACYQTTGELSPLSTASLDTQNSARAAAQAGRAARPTDSGPAPEYLTLDKAKTECWMQAESDKKAPKNVDARGKWVEKCAATKMREQATQWASPNASTPASSPQPTSLPTIPGLPPLPAFPSFPSGSSSSSGPGDVTQNGL